MGAGFQKWGSVFSVLGIIIYFPKGMDKATDFNPIGLA